MSAIIIKSPVYQQLYEALRAMIVRGDFDFGDKFFTEREVSARYEVSRATANKALASLVSEGMLEFRKGVGTFVRDNVIDYDLQSLVSFTEKARAAGKTPSSRVLTFGRVPAGKIDAAIAATLELKRDESVFWLRRLRLADNVPVILENRYIVAKHCPNLSMDDVDGSLYTAWTEKFALSISGAEEMIGAVNLDEQQAEFLGVAPGSAALQVTSLGIMMGHVPLWHERTLYRADQYAFRNHLGPIRTASPATGGLLTQPQSAA